VKQEKSHYRQSYLCHRSSGRFCNYLFHSVSNCLIVRRKLERGSPDHPGPLRKQPVRPRNKRRPTLLCQWILRRRLPGAVGRPCFPFRVCAGDRSGWPAHRPCRQTLLAVSGQRDLGGYRAVRCLLRRLERRPSSKANVLTINREDQAPHAVCGTKSGAAKTSAARSRHPIRGARRGSWRQHVCCCLSAWS
jgi:hypothetical protein